MARKLTPKQQKVVDQLILDPSLKQCAEVTGVSYDYIRELHTKTHILYILEKDRAKVSEKVREKAAVDAAYVLIQSVKLHERCMQSAPVLDSLGNQVMVNTPDGEVAAAFTFEHAGAAKGLELIGKHKDVMAFKESIGLELGADDGITRLLKEIADSTGHLPFGE